MASQIFNLHQLKLFQMKLRHRRGRLLTEGEYKKTLEQQEILEKTKSSKDIKILKDIIAQEAKKIKEARVTLGQEFVLNPEFLDNSEKKEQQEKIDQAIKQGNISTQILEAALQRIEALSSSKPGDPEVQQVLQDIEPSLGQSLADVDNLIEVSKRIEQTKAKSAKLKDPIKQKRQEMQELLEHLENYQELVEVFSERAKQQAKMDGSQQDKVKRFLTKTQDNLQHIQTLIEEPTFGKTQESLDKLGILLQRANEDIVRTGKELEITKSNEDITTFLMDIITEISRFIQDLKSLFSSSSTHLKQDPKKATKENSIVENASSGDGSQPPLITAFRETAKALAKKKEDLSREINPRPKP